MNSRGGAGCGLLLVGLFLISLVMWLIGGLLSLLGVLLPLAGVVLAVILGGYGWLNFFRGRQVARDLSQLDMELRLMVSEASLRLEQMLWRWEELDRTRGIGTDFEGRIDELRFADSRDPEALRVRQLLGEAREAHILLLGVDAATERRRCLKLLNRADRLWADLSRHYLGGTGTMGAKD